MSKGLTDVVGIEVGHASDYEGITGCTVILCRQGAVTGVDVRGSASGTEEIAVLDPLHVTGVMHGLVLTGGSAFGLEAASGVRRFLQRNGVGFDTGVAKVPIVCAAVLFDLGIGKSTARPTREMGEAAAVAASDALVKEGAIGAGTGATVGKVLGMSHAMKGGIGSATVWLDGEFAGVCVGAIAAVNALGDVRDPETWRLVAGTREHPNSMNLADSCRLIKRGTRAGFAARNTTLVAVATNARLTKVGATKLAQLASLGVARTIAPVWTMSDGDVTFALSCGDQQAPVDALGVAAAEAVAHAIVRAVRLAPSMGGVPGLA
ncbi:MAG: P1 family peptidase [Acidobacteria bacterium]|nr:P1 family peptidase [Acidobacteriota bacterium]